MTRLPRGMSSGFYAFMGAAKNLNSALESQMEQVGEGSLTTLDSERGRRIFQRLKAAVRADVPVNGWLRKLTKEGLTDEEVSFALTTCRERNQ